VPDIRATLLAPVPGNLSASGNLTAPSCDLGCSCRREHNCFPLDLPKKACQVAAQEGGFTWQTLAMFKEKGKIPSTWTADGKGNNLTVIAQEPLGTIKDGVNHDLRRKNSP